MNDYKYIEMPAKAATKGGRDLLTWGFGDVIDGAPVLWSSDAFRIHMSWAFNFPADKVPTFFPFASSDFGCLLPSSRPPDYRNVIGPVGDWKMQVNGTALLDAVKPYTKRQSVTLRYTPGFAQNEGDEAAHSPSVFEMYFSKDDGGPETTVNVLPYVIAPAPSKPFRIMLEPQKLADALSLPDDVEYWIQNTVGSDGPLRIGEWGRCLAVVMPMSTDY